MEDGFKKKKRPISLLRDDSYTVWGEARQVGTHHTLQNKVTRMYSNRNHPKYSARRNKGWKDSITEIWNSRTVWPNITWHQYIKVLYTKSEKWKSEKVPRVLMLNNDRIPACSIWTQTQDLPERTGCITYFGSWRKFFLICHWILFLK